MNWNECTSKAIDYIEDNITEDITMSDIAEHALVSPFYFQKGFAMLCGYTVSEYIKKRRLALAGSELLSTDAKIIDLAVKYGYDSADSFTKAFTRFHGATPSSVRKGKATIKSFAPMTIKLTLEGGFIMDYKIVKKDQFTVIGLSQKFKYDEAQVEVPKLWEKFHKSSQGGSICSMYGINNDASMGGNEFEYMIADNYNPTAEIPDGFTTKVIPEFTWAVFPCTGPMPEAIQKVNKKVFSEWLPANNDYEIAAGYNIEMYSDPADFANGTEDKNYYCEIWIPVKKK